MHCKKEFLFFKFSNKFPAETAETVNVVLLRSIFYRSSMDVKTRRFATCK